MGSQVSGRPGFRFAPSRPNVAAQRWPGWRPEGVRVPPMRLMADRRQRNLDSASLHPGYGYFEWRKVDVGTAHNPETVVVVAVVWVVVVAVGCARVVAVIVPGAAAQRPRPGTRGAPPVARRAESSRKPGPGRGEEPVISDSVVSEWGDRTEPGNRSCRGGCLGGSRSGGLRARSGG